LTMIYYDCLL
jgi:hypothetical protein